MVWIVRVVGVRLESYEESGRDGGDGGDGWGRWVDGRVEGMD